MGSQMRQTTLALRPYQAEALEAIAKAEQQGIRRPLLALPTGTGKTVVFAHLIAERAGRSLILAHRDELLRQAVDKLAQGAPGLEIGIVKAAENEVHTRCVVASVQTLTHARRLSRLTPDFDTVIIDEAHHAVAASYRRILDYLGSFRANGPLTLGVTATPGRGDKVGLDAVFQAIVYEKGLLEMICAGYLCDLRALSIHLNVDLNRVHTRAGDLIDAEVEALFIEADAPDQVSRAYREHAPGRHALVFAPTVDMAHAMAAQLCQDGIAAEWPSGQTPADVRQAILQRLHTGQTQVVCNCAVLTEGFDEPRVDCIVIARPTKSQLLYAQMIGRGTRLYPGKTDCLILDVVGATARHDLATVASLAGLPVSALLPGESVAEAADREAQEHQRLQAGGTLVARRVELFRQRAVHWLAHDRSFALSLGERGWVLLAPQEGTVETWRAIQIAPDGRHVPMAAGVSLEYAQGIAEDYARQCGAGGLVNPQATWRQRPVEAYPKMLAILQRNHLSREGMTAGEASDLISQRQLQRVLRMVTA